MPKYGSSVPKGTASVRTIASVNADATAPRRGKIYDVVVGNVSTPADVSFALEFIRVTAAPTATAVVPGPLDPADVAAVNDVFGTTTVDAVLTGQSLGGFGLNQRASFRWVPSPGGELLHAATASVGIALALTAASTSDFRALIHHEE